MKTFELNNGLRIVYEHIPKHHSPQSSIRLYIKVGSVNEEADRRKHNFKGMSHMVEHLIFLGTPSVESGFTFNDFFDQMGAFNDAYTEKDHTCIYINCKAGADTTKSIRMLSDVVTNSIFREEDVKKTYEVIREELGEDEDSVEDQIDRCVDNHLFKASPLANSVDILEYHRQPYEYNDLIAFYLYFYQPKNMVLSIATTDSFEHIQRAVMLSYFNLGCVDPLLQTLVQSDKSFEETMLHFGRSQNLLTTFTKSTTDSSTSESKLIFLDSAKSGYEQTYFSISFKTCSMYDKDQYAIEMLDQILNVSWSGRLMKILREEKGLIYHIGTYSSYYETTGTYNIQSSVHPDKIYEVLKIILIDILGGLIVGGEANISDDEMKKIRGNLLGINALNNDYIDDIAEYNGLRWLMNHPDFSRVSYEDRIREFYMGITKKDMIDCCRKYFSGSSSKGNNNNMCIVLGGKIASGGMKSRLQHLFDKFCSLAREF